MKKFIKNIIEFGNDMNRHNTAAYAASISFCFFLSLLPTLMFVFALIPYLPIDKLDIITAIETIIPHSLQSSFAQIVEDIYDNSVSLLPITAIATLWSAGMGMVGLIRGLNGVLDVEDKRNYFLLRLIAIGYTILMLLVELLTIVILGFGRSILEGIRQFFNIPQTVHNLFFFRIIFVWVILMIVFDLIYAFLPAERQRLSLSLPGAAIASLGWCVLTWGYSIYIDYFNGFSVYGNLTMIMVLLFWMYACFSLLIFGAFLNKYYKNYISCEYSKIRKKIKNGKDSKRSKKDS